MGLERAWFVKRKRKPTGKPWFTKEQKFRAELKRREGLAEWRLKQAESRKTIHMGTRDGRVVH